MGTQIDRMQLINDRYPTVDPIAEMLFDKGKQIAKEHKEYEEAMSGFKEWNDECDESLNN